MTRRQYSRELNRTGYKGRVEAARDYGSATAEDHIAVFVALGELIAADRGYGHSAERHRCATSRLMGAFAASKMHPPGAILPPKLK